MYGASANIMSMQFTSQQKSYNTQTQLLITKPSSNEDHHAASIQQTSRLLPRCKSAINQPITSISLAALVCV